MDTLSNQQQAVELLQELGLKEYEARTFVALTRLPQGTAKEISEISEVPRTRIYDAVRVLKSKGLVEIQHSNPQQFRAVPIDEAAAILRREYEERTDSLRTTLRRIDPADPDRDEEIAHEVWALSGTAAVDTRTEQLVDEAEGEVILVVADESVLSGALVERLQAALERGVSVAVGTATEAVRDRIRGELPGADVFVSELEGADHVEDATEIRRLLLVDRSTILVGSFHDTAEREHAVFGRGFDNGLVAIARRLMATVPCGPVE